MCLGEVFFMYVVFGVCYDLRSVLSFHQVLKNSSINPQHTSPPCCLLSLSSFRTMLGHLNYPASQWWSVYLFFRFWSFLFYVKYCLFLYLQRRQSIRLSLGLLRLPLGSLGLGERSVRRKLLQFRARLPGLLPLRAAVLHCIMLNAGRDLFTFCPICKCFSGEE